MLNGKIEALEDNRNKWMQKSKDLQVTNVFLSVFVHIFVVRI